MTFYAMVINDGLNEGILAMSVAEVLRLALEDLKWHSFEACFDIYKAQLLFACQPLTAAPTATPDETVIRMTP